MRGYAATILLVLTMVTSLAAHAQLATLFTTPQERKIIDNNRYKTERITAGINTNEASQIELLVLEEVEQSYEVNGIAVANGPPHSVWINGVMYQDGESLPDNSRVKVINGVRIRVRITTPDGKHHYASSGETLDVTYQSPADRRQ